MKVFLFLLSLSSLLYSSCKKDSDYKDSHEAALEGQWTWTIQYANNPAYNQTPQNTGIQETLSFNENGTYSLTQNGNITNTGTYRTATTESMTGRHIPSIYYTNSRVSDSVSYYSFADNNDTLFFSYDLIGTVGSGARYYARQ